jgi:hypothetical protein
VVELVAASDEKRQSAREGSLLPFAPCDSELTLRDGARFSSAAVV